MAATTVKTRYIVVHLISFLNGMALWPSPRDLSMHTHGSVLIIQQKDKENKNIGQGCVNKKLLASQPLC